MTAIPVGIISVFLIKRFHVRSIHGETIYIQEKKFTLGNIIGGFIFGLGWALTGACPGPLFAQIGAGFSIVIITLLSALAGVWIYSALRDKRRIKNTAYLCFKRLQYVNCSDYRRI